MTITKAQKPKPRTYIMGIMAGEMKRRLIVEVSETMTENHEEMAKVIMDNIKDKNLDKQGALDLRKELLGK